jgi:hypothetical protein
MGFRRMPLRSATVFALCLGLGACAVPALTNGPRTGAVPGTVPFGSPSDMTTAEGNQHGYQVYRCHRSWLHADSPWWLQGAAVVGNGSYEFPWLGDKLYENALLSQMRDQVLVELSGLDVYATAIGAPCHGPRPAFVVTLRDWREVDEAIRRLGGWLVRENMIGEVLVEVVVPEVDARAARPTSSDM